jgi:hypothetical protein
VPATTSRTLEPFRGSLAVARGEVTWSRLRRHEFRWVRPDTYVGADVPLDLFVRIRGLAVWGGPDAVIAGPLAALGWGVECPWDTDEIVLPTARRPGAVGARVRVDVLPPGEAGRAYLSPLTSPLRTAFDLARRVVSLMDGRAESLPESRLRVGLVLRGLPAPVPQYPVRLPNGRKARLDLAWPDPPRGLRPVALEYDGEEHRTLTRHGLDLDREAGLDDLGWDVVTVTARQLWDLDALVARLRRKLGR